MSTLSDLQHRSMIGLVEFSLLWWPRKNVGWCKWRFGMHQHYVSSSKFGYDETGLSGSSKNVCRRIFGEESVHGGRRNSSLHCKWKQWYTSAASKAEEYNESINKWQVYLRSISNRSEQCLFLVTQRSQFIWYLYTKMSRLQWKLFLVMRCIVEVSVWIPLVEVKCSVYR